MDMHETNHCLTLTESKPDTVQDPKSFYTGVPDILRHQPYIQNFTAQT